MRVEEVLRLSAMSDSGISDSGVFAECSGCGTEHRLGNVETTESDNLTRYVCPNCGTEFVFVGIEGGDAPELAGGIPHGGYVIAAPRGFSVQVPGRGRIQVKGSGKWPKDV